MNEMTEASGGFFLPEGLPSSPVRVVRHIRYVGADGMEVALERSLQGSGWQLTRSCERPANGVECRRCAGGIVQFSGCNDAEILLQWKEAAKSCDVRWIALPPQNLRGVSGLLDVFEHEVHDPRSPVVDMKRSLGARSHIDGLQRVEEHVCPNGSMIPAAWGIVGASRPLLHLLRDLKKVARTNAPVLITGESGTGKELAAAAVHAASPRANGPFIPINCASLPANLIQSELFGHEKGSFTGAQGRSVGRIEAASGGTVFLDEIGDLPPDLQTSLLRFLQEKTIERVGATKPMPVDVRVVAATNADLERAVKDGCFREDLYYRLNVFRLIVPPLRARKEDIEELARFFFVKFRADKNPNVTGFSVPALAAMREYNWPGNVRELANRVQKAMVMSENRLISCEDMGIASGASCEIPILSIEAARVAAERRAVLQALQATGDNVSEAALQLGMTRSTMYRLLEKLGLKHSQ